MNESKKEKRVKSCVSSNQQQHKQGDVSYNNKSQYTNDYYAMVQAYSLFLAPLYRRRRRRQSVVCI
jgi:hypothetical protein